MAENKRVLTLQSITTAGPQLYTRYSYAGYQFSQSFWYDFDLTALAETYSPEFIEKLFFNIAAFSTFHFCSFQPDIVDWGAYGRWHTPEFERVWTLALRKLSGQWRYENRLTKWKPPLFVSTSVADEKATVTTIQPDVKTPNALVLFGGGKDSVVMLDILHKAKISFSSLTYSHTCYGSSTLQHDRSAPILQLLPSSPIQGSHHKISIFEDFVSAPTLESLGKEVGTCSFIESETPLSFFAAIPTALFYGYTSIFVGNERSANVGNLMWEEVEGEEINHQWGKSIESELLLWKYVQDTLDYHDVDKLSLVYEEINQLVRDLHTYNLKLVMPIRDQVILDVPCGTGFYVREYFKEGAARVIASDIVAVEIEVSKKKAVKAGVPDDFVEYFVHDARIPKQLSTRLADVCSCIHLFCFAENLDQLRGMARMINVNLKPGGLCAVILCSIGNDDEKYREALESHKEMLVYMDPRPTERLQPRKVHTVCEGFKLVRYVWPHDVVSEVLKEEGFSRTEIIPYKFEPSSEYVQRYIDATARKMVVAWKTK